MQQCTRVELLSEVAGFYSAASHQSVIEPVLSISVYRLIPLLMFVGPQLVGETLGKKKKKMRVLGERQQVLHSP